MKTLLSILSICGPGFKKLILTWVMLAIFLAILNLFGQLDPVWKHHTDWQKIFVLGGASILTILLCFVLEKHWMVILDSFLEKNPKDENLTQDSS